MTESNATALANERRLHYRLMRQIYALCRSGEWHLRLDRLLGGGPACVDLGLFDHDGRPQTNCQGTVDEERHAVCVDYRVDIMATFVHECLHVLCRERFGADEGAAEESWVYQHEKLIMRHLSPLQARRLFVLMAEMIRRK